MHDIDRTQLEFAQYTAPPMRETFEFQEFGGGGLSEHEEVQFAHELLSVNNEQELEQFLGDFIGKITGKVGDFIRSPAGQAIGGVLKSVARKALPKAGAALGGYLSGSLGPLGAQIGTGLANAAGNALGLEFEMEGGEMEFEGARQFVRLAADTANNAIAQVQAGADPRTAAQQAAVNAAQRLAPGLLSTAQTPALGAAVPMPAGAQAASAMGQTAPGMMPVRHGHSGRWMRRGKHIILYGV